MASFGLRGVLPAFCIPGVEGTKSAQQLHIPISKSTLADWVEWWDLAFKRLRKCLGWCFPKRPHDGSQHLQKPVETVRCCTGCDGARCSEYHVAMAVWVCFCSVLESGNNGYLVLFMNSSLLHMCMVILLIEK
jgi:hypothetical protein